jgi:hypothetical protein
MRGFSERASRHRHKRDRYRLCIPFDSGVNKCRIVGEQDVNQVNENVDSELAPAGSAEIRAVLER